MALRDDNIKEVKKKNKYKYASPKKNYRCYVRDIGGHKENLLIADTKCIYETKTTKNTNAVIQPTIKEYLRI